MGENIMLSIIKLYILVLLLTLALVSFAPFYLPHEEDAIAEGAFGLDQDSASPLQLIEQTTILPFSSIVHQNTPRKMQVVVTAYSPSECETDNDPLITASGKFVQEGFVANNLLPFGTRIRLPKIFPNRTFIVEDRMHWSRGEEYVDVLFFSREAALNFGAHYTEMEILED